MSSSSSSSSAPTPSISLTSVEITPSEPAPLDSPLKIVFQFSTDRDIKQAIWEFKYIVDSAAKRHVVELGKTTPTSYSTGNNAFEFSTPTIPISHLKPSLLLNVGILSCNLYDGDKEVVEIKIVTQVSKNKEGKMMRVMFDPLA